MLQHCAKFLCVWCMRRGQLAARRLAIQPRLAPMPDGLSFGINSGIAAYRHGLFNWHSIGPFLPGLVSLRLGSVALASAVLVSVGKALLGRLLLSSLFFAYSAAAQAACFPKLNSADLPLADRVGAAQLLQHKDQLQGLRLGLVVNQSSRVGDCHLLDALRTNGFTVSAIFSPEHGFRGEADAGTPLSNTLDEQTGIPVYSLYGQHKAPQPADLAQVDLLLFDIQDVGVRFYTYLSTLHYVLEAAAQAGKPIWLLDRPNPNGRYVDGPVLQPKFKSFVGMHPIPLLHGMTLGELAQMIKGEHWITDAAKLQLTVLPVADYRRDMPYDLPVKPSPNLPNAQAVALYPSLGFFEATLVSVGRGTALPFQMLAHPLYRQGAFQIHPRSMTGAQNPPWRDRLVVGDDLRQVNAGGLQLKYLRQWQQILKELNQPFFEKPVFFDKLAGTDQLRQQLQRGSSSYEIRKSWQADLIKFRQQRLPYLIYPDSAPFSAKAHGKLD